jgi:hypothetical protein
MSETFVQLIEEAVDAVTGEVLDKSRVIDRLLDLRNAADDAALEESIDEILRSVPGRTMVETSWWLETLHNLRLEGVIAEEKTGAC